MDHQYWKNGTRNIYSNYYQMRANVECSPNQSKTVIDLIDLSIEALKIQEKCWPFPYLNFSRVLQFFSTRWLSLKFIPWILGDFRHNRIVRSPPENYLNVCR